MDSIRRISKKDKDPFPIRSIPGDYKQILLVDDQEENLNIYSTILTHAGYYVENALSAEIALDILKIFKPSLILLDIKLPGINGFELCEIIKHNSDLKEIPVIFLSGIDEPCNKVRGFDTGAVDYVTKPIKKSELLARVKTHISIYKLKHDLQYANKNLEEKVRKRTNDLEKANRELLNQIVISERVKKHAVKSEEKFRLIAENSNELFWLIDLKKGRLEYLSPAFEKITGYTIDYAYKEINNFLKIIKPNKPAKDVLQKFSTLENVIYEEFPFFHMDGTKKWLHQRLFPVIDKQGYGAGKIVGLSSDITELKNAQEREQIQTQKLITADKMTSLGILVSGIAHEINNPNNLIMFNSSVFKKAWKTITSQILEMGPAPIKVKGKTLTTQHFVEEIDNLVEGIEIGAERINKIVGDLKSFARQDSPSMHDTINLKDVIDSSLSIVGNLIKKSTNRFIIDIDNQVPSVIGNFQKIEQVIINLLTNACYALKSKEDSITVKGFFIKNENHVILEVVDTGRGIPEQIKKKVFDPFFSTRGDCEGTGLGLSISIGIIKEHGGDINIDSKEGSGTTIRVILPVA